MTEPYYAASAEPLGVRVRLSEDADRVRRAAELDRRLTDLGYPPSRDRRYPATLLDRAIEAWLAGHISIRPIAGLIGVDADDLLAEVVPVKSWPPTACGAMLAE